MSLKVACTRVLVVGMNEFYFATSANDAWGASWAFCSLNYIVPRFRSTISKPKVRLWEALFTTETALAVVRCCPPRVKNILKLFFEEDTAVALSKSKMKGLWSGVVAALGNRSRLLLCGRQGSEVYSWMRHWECRSCWNEMTFRRNLWQLNVFQLEPSKKR